MKLRQTAACLLLVAGVFSSVGLGGVRISGHIQELKNKKKTHLDQYFQNQRGKMVISLDGKHDSTVLLWADQRRLLVLKENSKKYTEITVEQIEALATLAKTMGPALKGQLKNMPEEQRKKIEMYLDQKSPPKVAIKDLGTNRKVGKWTCKMWRSTVNGKKTTDFCTVPMKTFGVTLADFKSITQLSVALQNASSFASADQFGQWATEEILKRGLVIYSMGYDTSEKPAHEFTVAEVEKKQFAPTFFEVPGGFAKDPAAAAFK